MGPPPEVAAVRLAVRSALAELAGSLDPPAQRPQRPQLSHQAQPAHQAQSARAAQMAQLPHAPHAAQSAQSAQMAELAHAPHAPQSAQMAELVHAPQSAHAPHAAPLVLTACSGGADSLALAGAVAFEAPKLGLRAGGITVDHGLQAGSAERAEAVKGLLGELGLDPVLAVRAEVAARPGAHPGGVSAAGPAGGQPYPGPEAAARAGRYAAFEAAAERTGAVAILLGHTLDDQAETVLLGLARGSGARSLAGMAPRSGRYLRPLLGLRREQTRKACVALGLDPWDDPHNEDPAYARVRVRRVLLPQLERQLGPGITAALARTADQLRADADLLDEMAAERAISLNNSGTLDVAGLSCLPAAIRSRILRSAAVAAGAPAGALTAAHVAAIDALVTGWRGQRWIDLPGGVRCRRRYGRLHFATRG